MTIKTQLIDDMKVAMKARNMEKLTTIRFLISEIKNFEIAGGISDDLAVQKIIASQVKKAKEAINDFKKAEREDLIVQEDSKIQIMSQYLPTQFDDLTLKKIIAEVIANAGDEINQGKIIGQVVKETAGRADGQRIKDLVGTTLASK